MKKLILFALLVSVNAFSVDKKANPKTINNQIMNIVVVDFLKIYNETHERADMGKRLTKEHEAYQKECDLYQQQLNNTPHQEYPPAPHYGEWYDKEEEDFRKRLQPVIEKVARLHCAHIVLASTYNDLRWDVLCLDKSYDITDEIINIMNEQYLNSKYGKKATITIIAKKK